LREIDRVEEGFAWLAELVRRADAEIVDRLLALIQLAQKKSK
jgi:hypothetical protein